MKNTLDETPMALNDGNLRSLLERYMQHLKDRTMTSRLEAHYRELLFEESISAYYGQDIWMKINVHV